MGLLRMKLDGEKYEIDLDTITLGEAEVLERDYGMGDFTDFNFMSARQMIGMFHIAVRRQHPELDDGEVRAKIEGIQAAGILEDINKQIQKAVKEAQAKEEDPPEAAASASAPAAPDGSRAVARKKPGTRR